MPVQPASVLEPKIHGFGHVMLPPAAGPTEYEQDPIMDAEQINAIGTQLADLSQRTVELRRYL